jgi:hypothetical protein
MQSLGWYYWRLKSMSATEVLWRLRSKMRDSIDRIRIPLHLYPAPDAATVPPDSPPPFRACGFAPGEWKTPGNPRVSDEWRAALIGKAEQIADCRLSYFDLRNHPHGNPIDWHRDHGSNKPAPRVYAQSIDYRDFSVTGDCKLVWEPNRHHQLVVLARAYRATGDVRFAAAVRDQLDSWLDQNPFGYGMNWRSPLELGVRVINWIWALDLIRESGQISGALRERVLHAVYLHCWENARKYSQASSANNHLVGEAAGVYIACAYFPEMRNAAHWKAEARDILAREIGNQSYPDGCTREQALGYQYFVLQFYLLCGLVGRWTGDEYPPAYWARIEAMLEFVGRLGEGGPLPLFGDADDGYVLDLGGEPRDFRALLTIGAVLFRRTDFKRWGGSWSEHAHWLLGQNGHALYESLETEDAGAPVTSHAFPASGYYLLQSGTTGAGDQLSVLFDCGELGYGAIAAHGHADALSFTLRVNGQEILVDPGTFDYFTYPAWRQYFRSTQAHNTIAIDDTDQSTMRGPFMWSTRAQSRCLQWAPRPTGALITAEHDGYARLADPVIHRRTLDLDGASGVLMLSDEIQANAAHEVAICFHFSESCRIRQVRPGCWDIATGDVHAVFELDERLRVELVTASDPPRGGWISRGYHRKSPTGTLIGRCRQQGSATYNCRITIGGGGTGA